MSELNKPHIKTNYVVVKQKLRKRAMSQTETGGLLSQHSPFLQINVLTFSSL